jgi:hypothetical protein
MPWLKRNLANDHSRNSVHSTSETQPRKAKPEQRFGHGQLCYPARLFLLVRHSRVEHTLLWTLRERLQQMAHVDPLPVNPSIMSSAGVRRE